MAQDEPRLVRPQLTLGGMCRLVAFVSIFLSCLLPLKEAGRYLWLGIACEALFVPLVLAVAVQVLVRRGAFRLWLTWFLLVLPVGVLFAITGFIAIIVVIGAVPQDSEGTILGFTAIATNVALGWLLVWLGKRLIPGRCPNCGRRRLFRGLWPRVERRRRMTLARCASCATRFERNRGGSWQPFPVRDAAEPALGDRPGIIER